MEPKLKGTFVTSSKVNKFRNLFEITSFHPSKGEFSEKIGIFSKCFGYHDALKIYGAPKLCCSKMTSFQPSEGVSEITLGSI